jgi:hypothetical protein
LSNLTKRSCIATKQTLNKFLDLFSFWSYGSSGMIELIFYSFLFIFCNCIPCILGNAVRVSHNIKLLQTKIFFLRTILYVDLADEKKLENHYKMCIENNSVG